MQEVFEKNILLRQADEGVGSEQGSVYEFLAPTDYAGKQDPKNLINLILNRWLFF
jgi:hypothetical protein